MKKTPAQKAMRALARRRARQTPHPINMYDLSSAGRAARRAKVYPFSSDRQNLRTARTQVMVENSNGHMVMNTCPAWGRLTVEEYENGVTLVSPPRTERVSANG